MSPKDSDGELIDALAHAAGRRQGVVSDMVEARELQDRARTFAKTLDAPEQERLLARLRIEEALAGKDMRRERAASPEGARLAAISAETQRLVDGFLGGDPESVIAGTRDAIADLVPDDDALLTATPQELYERLVGVTFENAAAAVGKEKAKKWIDLVAPAFQQGKGVDLVRGAGCIPHQLYDSKKFSEIVHFPHLAALHADLKRAEGEESGIVRGRVLQARAQLLKQLFLKGIAPEAQGAVTVDSNGLWVHLEQRKGKETTNRLDAHLPYEYATDDLLERMVADGWITEQDALECRLRRAEDLGDALGVREAESWKNDAYHALLQDEPLPNGSGKLRDEYLMQLNRSAKQGAPITRYPLGVLREDLHAYEPAYAYRSAMALAENVQRQVSHDKRNPELRGYDTYDLTTTARDSYEHRKNLLHDPLNYDVPRIVGTMLEAFEKRGAGAVPFRLLRGTVRGENAADNEHSFLEIVTADGGVQRVLIDADKQLTRSQRRIFDALPSLEKNEYELFETLSYAYRHYTLVASSLMAQADQLDEDDVGRRRAISLLMQDANAFLMLELPERFAEAMAAQSAFIDNDPDADIPFRYGEILGEALERFREKLFGGDIRDAVRGFNVKVNRHEVAFDDRFLDAFPERFKENSWTSDPALCEELAGIKQTIAVVDAGDREIPYAMEAKAIRALRLLPDRPLITVIGGCRDMPADGDGAKAVDAMCARLVEAGHVLRANIVPPGTQSGIGVTLGRASVAYQQRTADLPAAQKARFFAVSPGGETYYPGNPHLASENEKEAMAYAIGPFDTILTPFEAGWDWTGDRKKDAPYFRHVEYAEAIYNRVSAGQPRVTVVGNGGLFTIVEAIAALKNKSSVLLVRDTGRFADLAIALDGQRNDLARKQDNEEWTDAVLDLIRTAVPAHSTKALLDAFGESDPTPEQRLYREKLREYFVLALPDGAVVTTTVDALGESVERAATAWKAASKR